MRKYLTMFSLFLWASPQFAQEHETHKHDQGHDMSEMDMDAPLGLSMNRDGSGTSWLPDESPVEMFMTDLLGWHLMIHGNVFLGLDGQTSERGGVLFLSNNWVMAGLSRNIGPGRLSSRMMLSLEPLTVPGRGYPLLFQSGETWQGQKLHDVQHPHNLFMEAALRYQLPLNDELALDFYVAPVGEPALGPTAFVHRGSARSNPLAPLSHHWMDSTHISFGVLTMGVYGQEWKLEGSWFNGREPGENRYAFDVRVPDSYSGRLFYNPIPELSWQLSYGYLNSPEELEPEVGVHRVTTSVASALELFSDAHIAATLSYGMNLPTRGSATAFGLAEFNMDLFSSHTIFGRLEGGTKIGEELDLAPAVQDKAFGIGAISLGYAFKFPSIWKFVPSVGGVGTVNLTGAELGSYYGGSTQFGGMVFFQLGIGGNE